MHRLPPRSTRTVTLFPYPTLFRSEVIAQLRGGLLHKVAAVMATTCRTAPGWTGPGDADDGAVLLGDGDRPGGCVEGEAPTRHGRLAPASRAAASLAGSVIGRSEEHTSELPSLMRISYAVFCLKQKKKPRERTATN